MAENRCPSVTSSPARLFFTFSGNVDNPYCMQLYHVHICEYIAYSTMLRGIKHSRCIDIYIYIFLEN